MYLAKKIFFYIYHMTYLHLLYDSHRLPEAEFKEFERRFKFKPRIKYGWFHLELYQMFQDLGRR